MLVERACEHGGHVVLRYVAAERLGVDPHAAGSRIAGQAAPPHDRPGAIAVIHRDDVTQIGIASIPQ